MNRSASMIQLETTIQLENPESAMASAIPKVIKSPVATRRVTSLQPVIAKQLQSAVPAVSLRLMSSRPRKIARRPSQKSLLSFLSEQHAAIVSFAVVFSTPASFLQWPEHPRANSRCPARR